MYINLYTRMCLHICHQSFSASYAMIILQLKYHIVKVRKKSLYHYNSKVIRIKLSHRSVLFVRHEIAQTCIVCINIISINIYICVPIGFVSYLLGISFFDQTTPKFMFIAGMNIRWPL